MNEDCEIHVPMPKFLILGQINPYSPKPLPPIHLPSKRLNESIQRLSAPRKEPEWKYDPDALMREMHRQQKQSMSKHAIEGCVDRLYRVGMLHNDEKEKKLQKTFLGDQGIAKKQAIDDDQLNQALQRLYFKPFEKSQAKLEERKKEVPKKRSESAAAAARGARMYKDQVKHKGEVHDKMVAKYFRASPVKRLPRRTLLEAIERLYRTAD